MTTIIGWRDPFCLVSDDVETDPMTGIRTAVGAKVHRLSDRLAYGSSGFGLLQPTFKARAGGLVGVSDWRELEERLRALVLEVITPFTPLFAGISFAVVVGGTLDGQTGFAEWGLSQAMRAHEMPAAGMAPLNPYAAIGTGGVVAQVARSVARRWRPDVDGEELLGLLAETAADVDSGTGKPIWRLDLAPPIGAPYIWLP